MDVRQLAQRADQLHRDRKLMVFVGAGASVGTDGEIGAPSSNDLRDAIAEHFRLQVDRDSTLRTIANLAVQNSDEGEVKGFVANEVSASCVSPLRSHKALARIKPAIVMTTNYDDLVEQAFREELGQRPVVILSEQQIRNLSATRPNVFKLHGDVDASEKIILTTADGGR